MNPNSAPSAGPGTCDVAIIGGGIIGVATALRLLQERPGLSVVLLEKEARLAEHQTGRNSGVIHAGVYYQPGTIKAEFCKAGVAATLRFCDRHDIPYQQCGKLIVATDEADLPRLQALHERSQQNGLALELLDAAELKRREPHISGIRALYSPTTGIVDYSLVTWTMALEATRLGARIHVNSDVRVLREDAEGVSIDTTGGAFRAKQVIVCAGIMADRLARMCGLDLDFAMVPFRGEYYRLRPERDDLISHLIYPVPDPALPFLGVHLTRMIGGYLTVGPNAVLAFSREGYRFRDINPRDLMQTLAYPGFRRMARKYLRQGLSEMANSLSRRKYLALCQRYCPELVLEDLLPHRAGVRAQAVMRDGTIVHDFIIRNTARSIHVCNAPSPAATSSIPIAAHVVTEAARHFGWDSPARP